ncbi:DUF1641 domain-containing protein [Alicyclobacillus shizuokensis]|uniref:DUF1641 domain-containing protein n=1 Tax=Alicyclobacillus shizuokensis TaxID=392014 RepID=UPI00082E3DDE|nr:DUF1641 domain-containing protein [Alicyclobacillus shizuokensis]
MAQAIRLMAPTPRPAVGPDSATAIAEAAAKHHDAIQAGLRLLDALEKSGLLEMGSALLEQGSDVLEILVRQAGRPEYAGGIKNLIGLLQLLGRLDLARLQPLLAPFLRPAWDAAEAGQPEVAASPPAALRADGFFSLLAALRDPDVAAGLAWMLGLLQAVGRGLRQESGTAEGVE